MVRRINDASVCRDFVCCAQMNETVRCGIVAAAITQLQAQKNYPPPKHSLSNLPLRTPFNDVPCPCLPIPLCAPMPELPPSALAAPCRADVYICAMGSGGAAAAAERAGRAGTCVHATGPGLLLHQLHSAVKPPPRTHLQPPHPNLRPPPQQLYPLHVPTLTSDLLLNSYILSTSPP